MIDLLQGKLRQAMTLVNPIIGLPTPHQQQVDRVRHGASLIRRFVLENSVVCPNECGCLNCPSLSKCFPRKLEEQSK